MDGTVTFVLLCTPLPDSSSRIKFINYNALLLAVDRDASPEVIDFLLGKAISPVETDNIRGYDIIVALTVIDR